MRFNEFLREACPPLDLEWRKYRRRAARHRVDRRIAEVGCRDYASYLERLRSDPKEAAELADRMRVTLSRFFRERDRWEVLAEKVLPRLLAPGEQGEPLRIWSVGCCGGEEPYTLAILWLERFRNLYPGRRVKILATDIDEASLERAREALYDHGSLREVPAEMRRVWFRSEGGRWGPVPEVLELVEFEKHNLMEDPLPERMDLTCCRYLAFTYYGGQRRLEAARRLRRALRPGGALMIACKEDLGEAAELFTPWPQAPGVYRRPCG